MGWKEGNGLGKNEDGVKECIQIKRREEGKGIGKEIPKGSWADNWWEKQFDGVVKAIQI